MERSLQDTADSTPAAPPPDERVARHRAGARPGTRRLVAVSNRVGPVQGATVAGGLAVALVEALKASHGLWFGWSGRTAATEEEVQFQTEQAGRLSLATMDLTRHDLDDYYNGYANRCLWPLLHFRIDLTRYQQNYADAYRRVNAKFAARLLPLLESDDLVWAHDYHLIPLAAELRALGAQQRIGFFLHTPFPPADILETLPGHEQLMRALFDYDVIGLQTQPDVERLHGYIERYARGSIDGDQVSVYGRRVTLRAFPIGIDATQFQRLAVSAEGTREGLRMRGALNDRALIIGVDRLDYSKGLLRRMAGYELLLERYPAIHRKVELLQIAPISRGEVKAYKDFRRELEHAAAGVNGRFAQTDWTPVRYLNRALPRRTLGGLYRASRVGLVTPVRDGMNLVAKEYVAAQDPADPGVLVLSRFAGAAQQMRQALLVNPYDGAEMAEALHTALSMPLEERRARHGELMRGLLEQDVRRWRDEFVARLGASPAG